MAYSPTNDEENQKQLIAASKEGRGTFFFDDVKKFQSRVYIQAITSGKISGRLLGRSETVTTPNNFHWCGSSNNPDFGPEMARRVVIIRLNARTDDLNARVFRKRFDKEDHRKGIPFVAWVEQNRGRLIHAILVLAQNWIAGGREPFEKRTLTSFEEWARIVGGILQAAGVDGFLEARRPTAADPQTATERKFVNTWWTKFEAKSEPEAALVEWALGLEDLRIEGRDDDERRAKMHAKLADLDGRTFTVGLGDQSKKVMVRRIDSAGADGCEVHFALAVVPARQEAEEGESE